MIERRTSLVLGIILGALIGALVPGLWSEPFLSATSLWWGVAGALIGFYVAHRLSRS